MAQVLCLINRQSYISVQHFSMRKVTIHNVMTFLTAIIIVAVIIIIPLHGGGAIV